MFPTVCSRHWNANLPEYLSYIAHYTGITMAYLVFDIETAALPFEGFDETQQEYLLRGLETEEDQQRQKELMSLNPLTSQVVAIGMLYVASPEAEPQGFIYSNCKGEETDEGTFSDGTIWRTMSEQEMLVKWWEGLTRQNYHLVSFNGRGFDCPFLMLRSAALRIKPSVNLMSGTKWRYDNHTDLQDELAFYGFSGGLGPFKRFNFDFYCKSFGIESPKGEGLTGKEVPEFFEQGRHREIAEYCMRDVHATWKLYQYWKEYLDMRTGYA